MEAIPFNDLRAARRALGLTQAEVARAINRSTSHVCNLERGVRTPTAGERRALKLFFEVRALELASDKGAR